MALIIETEKYRHKSGDHYIVLLKIKAEDEDYREPVFIYQDYDRNFENCCGVWFVSLNRNLLDDYEKVEEE